MKRFGSESTSDGKSGNPDSFLITVLVRYSQIQYLISNLQKQGNTCCIRDTLVINDASIPRNSQIVSIQGYDVTNKSLAFTVDLLYMLRNRAVVTIQFSPTPSPKEECPHTKQEISISQCVLFLLSHYSTISSISPDMLKELRPNVIRNHYITLQQLNSRNPFLVLDDLLSPSDREHVLIVERLFIHAIKMLFPQPIIYQSYLQCFYEGSHYKPSLDPIRILLKRIPSPCLSPLYIIFRFYDTIYYQYKHFPTNEIVPLLCEEPDCSVMTTLILSSSQLIKDQRELWLAGCMLQWLSTKWQLDFTSLLPDEAQQHRTSSLLTMLQDCSTKLSVYLLLETNASINASDILQAVLLLLSGERDGLFGDWFITIAKSISLHGNHFNKVNQLRSLVQILPFCQRCCLFWLIRVLDVASNPKWDLLHYMTFTLVPRIMDMMENLLKTIAEHFEFVFTPSIPKSTCQLDSNEVVMSLLPTSETEITFPSFSMHSSFRILNEKAKESEDVVSDRSLLEKFYSLSETYSYARVIHSNHIEWNTPYNQIVYNKN